MARGGIIWDGIPFETPVIPAKAGIQFVDSTFPEVGRVDSRFRGNDRGFDRPCLANDTTRNGASKESFSIMIEYVVRKPDFSKRRFR
jgi:hypothetical protein